VDEAAHYASSVHQFPLSHLSPAWAARRVVRLALLPTVTLLYTLFVLGGFMCGALGLAAVARPANGPPGALTSFARGHAPAAHAVGDSTPLGEWLSIPGALTHMTGQQVPRLDTSGVDVAEDGAKAPTGDVGEAGGATNWPTPPPPPSASGPLLPQHRFTILLLGSDDDLKFTPNAVLTQSMILVSVDPQTADVALVSIPRDFWVPIRGYGYAKIDVAYEVGGIALARATVEQLFGISVDYYGWVGLNGLVQVIDSLGGVDVTVLHPVLDEAYPDDLEGPDPYAYHRLYIPAGPQHLDGRTALQYVRSRHGDLQSDFGRSARQQQVLLALKDLARDPAVTTRLPALVEALHDAVKTDLSLPAIAQLVALARTIGPDHIQQRVLAAPQYATLGWSPDHQQQVVYPNWDRIRPEIARLLRPGEASGLGR